MSRTFDTGLPVAKRTLVRNTVMQLLAPMLKGNSYLRGSEPVKGFLNALVKLPGTLRSYDAGESLDQLYKALLGRAPAIGVALGDRVFNPAGIGGHRAMSFLDVHIFFVNNHQRSLMARVEADVVAAGDGEDLEGNDEADQGIDIAMECAEELLTGQRLDTATEGAVVKHLELKREQDVYTGKQHTIWEQTWLVGVTSTINKNRAITQRITDFHTVLHPPTEPAESPAAVIFDTEMELST